MPQPDLSVVVAVQGLAPEAADCLNSLLAQKEFDQQLLEVIVCEGPPFAASNVLEAQFPNVRFMQSTGTSIPELHGTGVASSKGQLVAITEGHCTFATDWAANAVTAHRATNAQVIGGAVLPGPALSQSDKALFLCDYAQFVPPLTAGRNSDLPGNNIIFKRECLDASENFAVHGFWKTFFCKRLEKQGAELLADPTLQVFYNRNLSFSDAIARRYNHGRCFGGMRAASGTLEKRVIYFLAGWILPLLLFYKLVGRCWPRQACRELLLRDLFRTGLFLKVWVLGEWIGNLFGPGDCCTKL
jgi:hypothetical protein